MASTLKVLQPALNTPAAARHAPARALAAIWQQAPCGTDSGHAPCSFFSILHLLDILAAILAVVLIVVLTIAVYAFRKNRVTNRKRQRAGLGVDLDEPEDLDK